MPLSFDSSACALLLFRVPFAPWLWVFVCVVFSTRRLVFFSCQPSQCQGDGSKGFSTTYKSPPGFPRNTPCSTQPPCQAPAPTPLLRHLISPSQKPCGSLELAPRPRRPAVGLECVWESSLGLSASPAVGKCWSGTGLGGGVLGAPFSPALAPSSQYLGEALLPERQEALRPPGARTKARHDACDHQNSTPSFTTAVFIGGQLVAGADGPKVTGRSQALAAHPVLDRQTAPWSACQPVSPWPRSREAAGSHLALLTPHHVDVPAPSSA